jgi:hypothetical protein
MFDVSVGSILQRFFNGETIILKGKLSKDVTDRLNTLFLDKPYIVINGEKEYPKGHLIIITNEFTTLPDVSQRYEHQYQLNDYWNALKIHFSSDYVSQLQNACAQIQQENNSVKFNYSQLNFLLKAFTANPKANPFEQLWKLDKSKQSLINTAEKFFPKTQDQNLLASLNFDEERLLKIKEQFEYSPYAFIVGESGIGKSSFVINKLKNLYKIKYDLNVSLYIGFENLKTWLTSTSPGLKILFLDEANLEIETKFNIFDGLFNPTPGLIENIFYPITPEFKVIFGGNFYEGKQLHDLFANHGAIIEFKAPPLQYLSQEIMVPVLKDGLPELSTSELDEIVEIFLNIYNFFNEHSSTLLTSRNLQMMCLRFVLLKREYGKYFDHFIVPVTNTINAYMAGYDEVKYLLQGNALNEFKAWMEQNKEISNFPFAKYKKSLKAITLPFYSEEFFTTSSRRSIIHFFDDQLKIRGLKLAFPKLNDYGICGLLFEGPSAIGKSTVVVNYLRKLGFEDSEDAPLAKRFYYLTSKLLPIDPLKLMRKLQKAFHEGAIVVIDELNSLPGELIGSIFNIFMTNVDLQGQKAERKGFFVIATQNPISFSGRKKLLFPLENRFQKIVWQDYPENELLEILLNKDIDFEVAEQLIKEFTEAKQIAIKKGIHIPTLRDLLSEAEKPKENRKRKINSSPLNLLEIPNVGVKRKYAFFSNSDLSNPAYKQYSPLYQDQETSEEFKRRLIKKEEESGVPRSDPMIFNEFYKFT